MHKIRRKIKIKAEKPECLIKLAFYFVLGKI